MRKRRLRRGCRGKQSTKRDPEVGIRDQRDRGSSVRSSRNIQESPEERGSDKVVTSSRSKTVRNVVSVVLDGPDPGGPGPVQVGVLHRVTEA
jgi:hypothetical protein